MVLWAEISVAFDFCITSDDCEMVVEFRVKLLILLRELLNARLHVVAQLYDFVLRWQQVKKFLHFL